MLKLQGTWIQLRKNRTSYQNLLQFSDFNDRRALIKMKRKIHMSTDFFRFYGTFYEVCICLISKRKKIVSINLVGN